MREWEGGRERERESVFFLGERYSVWKSSLKLTAAAEAIVGAGDEKCMPF